MATQSDKFSMDFAMGGAAALIAKSVVAPMDRVKLLLQNQGEMIKRGNLQKPYGGLTDCFGRVLKEDGFLSFWRGNQANVIRYFPTQVPCLAFSEFECCDICSWRIVSFMDLEIFISGCSNCIVSHANSIFFLEKRSYCVMVLFCWLDWDKMRSTTIEVRILNLWIFWPKKKETLDLKRVLWKSN